MTDFNPIKLVPIVGSLFVLTFATWAVLDFGSMRSNHLLDDTDNQSKSKTKKGGNRSKKSRRV
jgi:Na+/H+ antiporter NhaC